MAGDRLTNSTPFTRCDDTVSPVLSRGAPGKHRIQGIDACFVPDVLDRSLVDEIVQVTDDEAMAAALKVAARPECAGRTLVVVLPDSGERYRSTRLFEDAA